ncbi:MAG TPA: tetratricopeptide repeat protein [Aliidongia sp.]|nr:tetratricopeptide repeat protein [Aliidongia sp.]
MDPTERQSSAHEIGRQFGAAQQHHQAGRLAEAEGIYRRILGGQPGHIGALHGLGLLALQAGRNDAAVELLSRAAAQGKRVPQLRYLLGLAYRGQRRFDDAARAFAEALRMAPGMVEADCALAALAGEQGRIDEAAAHYRRILAAKPDCTEALTGLGGLLLGAGRTEEAAGSFARVAELLPEVAEAHANSAQALKALGRLDEATAAYERALALRPGLVQAWNELGSVHAAQGRTEQAIAHYRHAIGLAPRFAEAHHNLGNALTETEQFEEAIRHFEQAVLLKPALAEARYNLASLQLARGEAAIALAQACASRALLDTPACRSLIVQCLTRSNLHQDVGSLEKLIIRALDEAWSGANTLSITSIMLLRRNPAILAMLDRIETAWPAPVPPAALFGDGGLAVLAGSPLLLSLLRNVVACDMGFERLLGVAREALLDAALAGGEPSAEMLAFHCSLARQCFITEYVYDTPETEAERARGLWDRLAAEPSALAVAAVAAYFPLLSLDGAERLLDLSWPPPVEALLDQQLREPLEERAIRRALPTLTPIEAGVSRAVQEQYEENPYPRWVAPAAEAEQRLAEDGTDRLAALRAKARQRGGVMDILIAGCGTGQHSIEIARRYAEARVLAIDLSRASLAYATRMTRRLGLENLEHAQADILALGNLDRRFDNIESVGVLHHLGDPQAGLDILVGLLRPNGLIRLGLYSELARRSIVAARDFIAAGGYESDASAIRRCRQDLARAENRGQFDKFMRSGDFFSVSGVRDLLFHVQEHRFTVPMLSQALARAGLRFIGFDLSNELTAQYRRRFPEDKPMTDLDRWHVFETENPDSFTGMYQFWAQKPGE